MKIYITFLSLFLFHQSILCANFEVKMLNQGSSGVMVFEPSVLKIELGDSVTFKASDAAHNSASISGMIPLGAKAWNGELSRDITVTFDTPGVYGYQCTPHSMMAMVGIIQVDDNQSNLNEVESAVKIFKSKFVMNQNRFDDYLKMLATQ